MTQWEWEKGRVNTVTNFKTKTEIHRVRANKCVNLLQENYQQRQSTKFYHIFLPFISFMDFKDYSLSKPIPQPPSTLLNFGDCQKSMSNLLDTCASSEFTSRKTSSVSRSSSMMQTLGSGTEALLDS